jgi:branched-chain amino acid transport system ATP-binding protein
MTATKTLLLANVTAGYGSKVVLTECSLSVGAGEVVGVIGANGAGKTTLLRSISRLTRIFAGDIVLAGTSLLSVKPYSVPRLGVGHVPEGRGLFGDMTVRDNLMLGGFTRRARAVDENVVLKLAPVLLERMGQQASTLSGGEQQLLAIARAMMQDPRVLLLDEPSQGLSPAAVSEIGRTIRTIASAGTAVILAEQNAAMVNAVVDSVATMGHGTIRRVYGRGELGQADLAQLLLE